jgi:hypothetical protein
MVETRLDTQFLFSVGTLDAYDVEFVVVNAPDEKHARFVADRIYGKYKTTFLGKPRTLNCKP